MDMCCQYGPNFWNNELILILQAVSVEGNIMIMYISYKGPIKLLLEPERSGDWEWANVPKAVLGASIHRTSSLQAPPRPGFELKAASLCHINRGGKSKHVRDKNYVEWNIFRKLKTLEHEWRQYMPFTPLTYPEMLRPKKHSAAFSPQASYTGRAAAPYPWSYCRLLRVDGCRMVCASGPNGRYFSFK
jgi:hypothetical protein